LTCTLTPLTESAIKSQVNDQVFLTKENVDHWGSVPGSLGLNFTRDLTVFNFSNPDAVFLHHEKPVFQMTPSVPFIETQSVSNLN